MSHSTAVSLPRLYMRNILVLHCISCGVIGCQRQMSHWFIEGRHSVQEAASTWQWALSKFIKLPPYPTSSLSPHLHLRLCVSACQCPKYSHFTPLMTSKWMQPGLALCHHTFKRTISSNSSLTTQEQTSVYTN